MTVDLSLVMVVERFSEVACPFSFSKSFLVGITAVNRLSDSVYSFICLFHW